MSLLVCKRARYIMETIKNRERTNQQKWFCLPACKRARYNLTTIKHLKKCTNIFTTQYVVCLHSARYILETTRDQTHNYHQNEITRELTGGHPKTNWMNLKIKQKIACSPSHIILKAIQNLKYKKNKIK